MSRGLGDVYKRQVYIQHSQVFCSLQAFQNVDHFQQILDHLWSICATLLLHCTHCIIPEILLNYLNSFHGGLFKLNAKFDADSLLYLLSHFECDSHTVHMLTQWHLPPPLTSTVKLSLFRHVHSSPLSLTARLHGCGANYCYINNGWTFTRQTIGQLKIQSMSVEKGGSQSTISLSLSSSAMCN